jgi:hypothetical protein
MTHLPNTHSKPPGHPSLAVKLKQVARTTVITYQKATAGITDTLYLSFEELTEIPHDLESAKKIKKLMLSFNDIKKIPEDFSANTEWSSTLVLLDLSYNRIDNLPSILGMLQSTNAAINK